MALPQLLLALAQYMHGPLGLGNVALPSLPRISRLLAEYAFKATQVSQKNTLGLRRDSLEAVSRKP